MNVYFTSRSKRFWFPVIERSVFIMSVVSLLVGRRATPRIDTVVLSTGCEKVRNATAAPPGKFL